MSINSIVQPPVMDKKQRSITKQETSGFAIDGMTIPTQMEARAWKRSRRSLRYPVCCSEYHPYLNPDASIAPDRDVETPGAAAAHFLTANFHRNRKRSGKSQSKISKKPKSKRAKLAKHQSTDVQTEQPSSKGSKRSKPLKNSQPSTSKRSQAGKDTRKVPKHDDFLDLERSAFMDTFERDMMAETYGYEFASRMDPASWDYNFF